ncbi:uncharacterized protein ARMOST_19528 [Armillaria ostoyae]|uniref:Uncharacterized protein n=1 Tax=Armillaria ostoyae TaxID=47428 RepID=A0A284S4S3_ARMOS|nr:uncharacterized protein ARMOST_19528 [Armillaria ostoyae]
MFTIISRILDTLHIAISTHALYFYLVESFGNYVSQFEIIWSFPLQLLVNMLIVVGVQALYAIRILKFGRNFHEVLPWFIFLAVAASFGETSVFSMNEDLNKILKPLESMLFTIRMGHVSLRPLSPMLTLSPRYTLSSFLDIPTISTSIYVVFSTLAGADFCIAATMCFYLHKGRSMTGFSRKNLPVVH